MKLIINMDVDSPCNDAHSGTIPVRTLLAAILDRAYRDLSPAEDPKDRVKAINWFNCSSACPDWEAGIRFCDVIDGLELPPGRVDFLINAAMDAYLDEYKSMSKRKTSRKKRCELVKGQRFLISEAY